MHNERSEWKRSAGDSNRLPIVRLKDILIVPVQGSLNDRQATDLQEDILWALEKRRARAVVVDISAVPIMDSFIARILNNIARNARLMGARGVIVGMRPAIAITLVTMGLEFEKLETALNLDRAIEMLGNEHG